MSIEATMSEMGHSLPIHSAPVPTNVRYASDSDRQPSQDRLTLSAKSSRPWLLKGPEEWSQ